MSIQRLKALREYVDLHDAEIHSTLQLDAWYLGGGKETAQSLAFGDKPIWETDATACFMGHAALMLDFRDMGFEPVPAVREIDGFRRISYNNLRTSSHLKPYFPGSGCGAPAVIDFFGFSKREFASVICRTSYKANVENFEIVTEFLTKIDRMIWKRKATRFFLAPFRLLQG
jgi:hypothetical protein